MKEPRALARFLGNLHTFITGQDQESDQKEAKISLQVRFLGNLSR